MIDFFELKKPIGRSYNTDPGDVLKTKKALSGLGYYDEPEYGITPYPDTNLIRGLENFQRDHGLHPDGIMKPDGPTQRTMEYRMFEDRADARRLQELGRNGDSILAHISPKEARLLKQKGGSGTVHPVTGLLEFSENTKKEGSYIWHTQGDGKVRSSHAERDGKVFSWDNPPEGGHPGEDYNCRCWAEDVEDDKYKCERILWEVEAAWQRHDDLHEPILKAEAKVLETEQRLENLLSELEEVQHEIMMLAVPDRPSKIIDKGTIFGLGAMAYQYKKLKEREAQLLSEINGVKWVLGKAKEKLNQLESKREDHKLNAISMTRQYKECLATHKKS